MLLATSRFLAIVICVLLVTTPSFAATPLTFTYQGYLKDAAGVPVSDKLTILFSLYANDVDEISVWKETQQVTPVNGIYSVVLGADTQSNPLDPATVTDTLFLGIKVGNDQEMKPRQALTSSPFAIRAAVADTVADGSITNASFGEIISGNLLDLSPYMHSRGFANFFAGTSSGSAIVEGAGNTGVGFNTLGINVGGHGNTALGLNALAETNATTSGTANSNTGLGQYSLSSNRTGSYNTAVGSFSGGNLLEGTNNTFLGAATGQVTTAPLTNATAVGYGVQVTQSNSMVLGNAAVKVGIGTSTPTEKLEVVGNIKLPSSTATTGRIMMGTETVLHSPNASNIFTGSNAGNSINTGTGISNTATGHMALSTNADGHANTAVGASALKSAYADSEIPDSGGNNTAVGAYALQGITTGTGNTAVGSFAGAPFGGTTAPARTGVNNTFIGTESGQGVDAALFNATAIGYQALVSQSNSMVLGRPGLQVGIGTSTPTAELDVVGNVKVSGTLTPGSLNLPLNSLAVGTNQLTVVGNNVGIGTNAPEAKLDVVGNAAITGPLTAGSLTLPADSLTVGTNQLKLSGGMVGIGATPTTAKLQVTNSGPSGQTALFQNTNPANGLPTVYATTVSSGDTLYSLAQGTGTAGHFQISNPGSSASALVAETSGSGYAAEILGNMRVTGPIVSTVATGVAPLTVASTTEVTNLNANLLNGKLASEIISAASDEVRTPISSCGTLDAPGSYYLTRNLSATTGSCITVPIANITIDLMGFTLTGNNLSGFGIDVANDNVEIRNGSVQRFRYGIRSAQLSTRVINVYSRLNTDNGIYITGEGGLVRDCTSTNNGGAGIYINMGTLVTNSTVFGNSGAGIVLGGSSSVINNFVYSNGSAGINSTGVVNPGVKIVGNTVNYNNINNEPSSGGIVTSSSAMVKDNMLSGNQGINILPNGNYNMIEDNVVMHSDNGIWFGSPANFYKNNKSIHNTTGYNNSGLQIDGGGNINF